MQLSNRQLFILSYLLNHPQRISGEHLASQAGISVRTLQGEIQEICQILKGGIRIDASGKRGYQVSEVSPEVREMLLDQALDRHSIYMPEERVNDIYTVLLFARDYVSMETVANTLYMSKTSVYRTIENNNALRKMVTVSRTRGLLIDRPERIRRRALAKVFDKDAQNPPARELREEYIRLDRILRPVLIRVFEDHRYRVSGEALRSFRRYLIITILRSARGYALEETDYHLQVSSLMRDIIAALREEGIGLSASEVQDCQAHLNNLCTFIKDLPAHRTGWLTRWEEAYSRFVETARARYGLELEMAEEDRRRFLLHVNKLCSRVMTEEHDSNYHKREINRMYPLSVHLIILIFEECFGFPVPETEISFLAMYIAIRLRKHFRRIDCMIVTAKNPSVAWPMKQWVEEHFSRHIRSVEIMEHYRFRPEMARDDLLILTTEESVVLSCPQAILVRPFGLQEEYEIIDLLIQEIRAGRKEEFFSKFMARCCSGVEEMDARGRSLYDLLEDMGIAVRPGITYEFVLDTNAYLCPRVHEGKGDNRIRIFYLPHTIFHRGTDLRYLVLSDYYTGTGEMLDFYHCIQTLLAPGRLDSVRRDGF
jgi:lichenan operon transcriptional antiterminator